MNNLYCDRQALATHFMKTCFTEWTTVKKIQCIDRMIKSINTCPRTMNKN